MGLSYTKQQATPTAAKPAWNYTVTRINLLMLYKVILLLQHEKKFIFKSLVSYKALLASIVSIVNKESKVCLKITFRIHHLTFKLVSLEKYQSFMNLEKVEEIEKYFHQRHFLGKFCVIFRIQACTAPFLKSLWLSTMSRNYHGNYHQKKQACVVDCLRNYFSFAF